MLTAADDAARDPAAAMRQLLEALGDAVVRRDAVRLEATLDAEFVATGYNARVVDRDAYRDIHIGPLHRFTRFEPDQLAIRTYDGFALATGRWFVVDAGPVAAAGPDAPATGAPAPSAPATGDAGMVMVFTACAIRRPWGWRLLAYHETRIPRAPAD